MYLHTQKLAIQWTFAFFLFFLERTMRRVLANKETEVEVA